MWNQNYSDCYGFSAGALHRGMILEDVTQLGSKLGSHPERAAAEFYETYTGKLLANCNGARLKSQEVVRGGRTIETAHVYSEALVWVATHEDIVDEVARIEVVQKRKLELERQNIRLDAAVNNISQGLCMMDARGRLVICNEPYARICSLPEQLLRPGTQLEQI
ncbi:MAG: PAS-domain containing protein, partial [Candidatus Devosia euplotis]|nr:PAS-domain containing protein [Candidatus Devosia euplotis]